MLKPPMLLFFFIYEFVGPGTMLYFLTFAAKDFLETCIVFRGCVFHQFQGHPRHRVIIILFPVFFNIPLKTPRIPISTLRERNFKRAGTPGRHTPLQALWNFQEGPGCVKPGVHSNNR
jgi:hypothetical protein